jgi:hypothetical protein
MTADHLATLCHIWFTIPEPLQFNGNDLNNALLKDPALKLDIQADKSAPNQFGIYHNTYRTRGANRSHCYYLGDPDHKECVKSPPIGKAWYDTIPELIGEIESLERASRNKEQRQFPTDVIELVSKANARLIHERDNKLENTRSTKKRRLLHESDNSANSSNSQHGEGRSDGSDGSDKESNSRIDGNKNGNESLAPEQSKSRPNPPQLAPGYNIWWDSMEAQKLFNVLKEKETVVGRLEDLITILDNENSTALSYKTIVEGNDPDNTMSEHKKERIQMKAR